MRSLTDLIDLLITKRTRLNELRAQSPELAEAIQLAEEYQMLLHEVEQRCHEQAPQYVPVPYPSPQPVYPWWHPLNPYRITCAPGTTGDILPEPAYRVTCSAMSDALSPLALVRM